MANIKSPVYLRLETMIDTLQMIRSQLDGKRIPKFEETFIERKKMEEEMAKKEKRR